jgi:hypothetical protein|tara:strand:+ start:592 stop:1140 length:549 start_codon:yes stop_codon:yes gene_type:complete
MAVLVKIGKSDTEGPKKFEPIKLKLNIRKTLDGNILIFDHADIDIIVMPKENKVVALSKEQMTDMVYGAQNRLFDYLRKKGVIDFASVHGGSVYGSMQAMILAAEDNSNAVQHIILNVSKFIDEERPYFDFVQSYMDQEEDQLLDPDNLNSTDLGDVPHSSEKGSIRPDKVRDPYGLGMSHY